MSYYEDVYLKRLNRYGLDYQSRLQGQRERNFDDYLLKTLYRVDFEYEGRTCAASLERYKQDYSETQAYLLTKRDLNLPNGTVLDIISRNGDKTPWMIWWLEKIESSGYNKYVILKMTNRFIISTSDFSINQWSYFSGPGISKIQETIKSPTGKSLYSEENTLHMIITPYNVNLQKDLYFEITTQGIKNGYVITDIDINSTPGISYVSADPVPLRIEQQQPSTIKEEGINWLTG